MKKAIIPISIIIAIITAVIMFILIDKSNPTNKTSNQNETGNQTQLKLTLGISPYQDTAIPVITDELDIDQKFGLEIEIRPVAWSQVTTIVASAGKTVDVALGSINTFLPRANNVNRGASDPVIFYAPLYVFRGGSLVMDKKLGLKTYKEILRNHDGNQELALKATMEQIRGMTIALPFGTPYDQLLSAAEQRTNIVRTRDFRVIDTGLAEALPALFSSSVQLIGAGVTQRTEAERSGHLALLEMDDLDFVEIVGLLTKKSFAESHAKELDNLVLAWFETIDRLFNNPSLVSVPIVEYLKSNASTVYTSEEYVKALTWQYFPRNLNEGTQAFNSINGKYNWRETWDVISAYLVKTGKIEQNVPLDYYWNTNIVTGEIEK